MLAFPDRLCTAAMLLTFALGSPVVAAPADRPGDYSHTSSVGVSGKQAVVQLPLPRAVYLEARSAGLRDLRLFDAAGVPLPFALIEQMQQTQESRSTAQARIFPVSGPTGINRLPHGLEIRTGDNGTVISVAPTPGRNASDALVSLVLDLQGAAHASAPVAALALTLPPEMASYNAHLALDISDDLQEWEEVATASVSWLVNSQGARVQKHRIAFAPRAIRFARLRWIEGTPIEFAAVSAELVARERTPARWESVVLQPKPTGGEADLVYEAPVAIPVRAIGLQLQGHNIVVGALIGHYRNTHDRPPGSNAPLRLQPLVNATFFQLTQNGQRRVSGDVDVPLTHASEWVVRPKIGMTEAPGLRLSWKPASMVFVAGGKPPYTLAFGREGVPSGQVPLAQVAPGFSTHELARLEQATAGAVMRRHPDEPGAGAAGAREASRTRVVWLWTLLVGGMAILAFMVWKLSRQMKEGGEGVIQQPPP